MKVNYKSDFSLVIQLTAGGEAVAVPTWDWSMMFYTCDRQAVYQCSRIGGVCDRCKVNADGTVTVYFDKHGLRPGALVCEFCNHIPDTNFSFDKRITFDPVTLDVELVRGAGDEGMTPVELELAGDLLAQLQAIIEGLDVVTDYIVNVSAVWDDEENCFVAPPLPSGPGLPSWATIHHYALAALAEGRVVRYKVALLVDVSDVGYRVHDFAVASYNATAPTSVIKAVGYEDDTDNATPELFSLYHDESGVRVYSRDVATLEAVEEAVAPLQPRLTAGTGIDITNNVISATGGGGGDALIVTLTPSQDNKFTPDKTFAEAIAAHTEGRKVMFSITQENQTTMIDVYWSGGTSDNGLISAMTLWTDVDVDVVNTFEWSPSSPYVLLIRSTLQPKLTAGSGITIANNVISAAIPDGAYIIDVDIDADPMTTTAVFADALAAFESGRQVWFACTSGGDLVFSVPVTFNYGGAILAGITWIDNEQQIFSFTANGVIYGQVTFVNTTALATALAGKQDVLALVEVTATGDVTQALDSGKFYRFGSVDSLTLTFTAPSAGMGMWGGKFTASANWSALGIPATIDEAAGNDSIAGGKTYEFNVLDGIIVIKEV